MAAAAISPGIDFRLLRRQLPPLRPALQRKDGNGSSSEHPHLSSSFPPFTSSLAATAASSPPSALRRTRPLHRCYASPAEAAPPLSQQSSTHGLVFSLGAADSWDSGEIGSPVVKRFVSDDADWWLMWYYGRRNTPDGSGDSIGIATSSDGIQWERDPTTNGGDGGPVLSRSTDWWVFDTAGVRPSDVVTMSSEKVRSPGSVYWLYYTGFTPERVDTSNGNGNGSEHLRSLPGLAMSQDGRHWARIEGDHHTGALFDAGTEDDWDSSFAAAPRVVYHSPGDLRMYYHSLDRDTGRYSIGIARSRDGINWVKLGKALEGGGRGSFDEGGAVSGHVVRDRKSGSYLMAYEGVSSSPAGRSIGLAMSADGLKEWRRCGEEAVLKPSEEGGWDDGGVGSPHLVQMDGLGEWRLYYRGIGRDGRTGIGVAVSEPKRGNGSSLAVLSFSRVGGT